MIYRYCKTCGAMLPDDDEASKAHLEWHQRLFKLLAAVVPVNNDELIALMEKI